MYFLMLNFWIKKKIVCNHFNYFRLQLMKKIIIRSVAWLANQMHQYAFGRALALEYNALLYLDTNPFYYDTRSYELDIFNIQAEIASNKERPRYLQLWKNKLLDTLWYPVQFACKKLDPYYLIENPHHPRVHRSMYDYNPHIREKVLATEHDVYLEWFRHSEKYFIQYEDIIRQDFRLKKPISDPYNVQLIEQMESSNSVSIHVRRGDYAGSQYEGICNITYYHQAISCIQEKIPNPTFFVLSDDIARCQEQFKDYPITAYCENWGNGRTKNLSNKWTEKHGADAYKNMILMSRCKHNIIANSTFSRRWAWLNAFPEKIVIAPAQWHHHLDYADIIPESRVKI